MQGTLKSAFNIYERTEPHTASTHAHTQGVQHLFLPLLKIRATLLGQRAHLRLLPFPLRLHLVGLARHINSPRCATPTHHRPWLPLLSGLDDARS